MDSLNREWILRRASEECGQGTIMQQLLYRASLRISEGKIEEALDLALEAIKLWRH